jgi:hypothetical protein
MKYLAIFLITYGALATAAWHNETKRHTETYRALSLVTRRNIELLEEQVRCLEYLERVHSASIVQTP